MNIELHEIKNLDNGFRFYAEINRHYEAYVDINFAGEMIDGTYKPESNPGVRLYKKAVAYAKEKDLIK